MWIYGVDSGGNPVKILVDTDGHLQVDTLSSALPTGAATSAKQDSILTELQQKLGTADLNLDVDGDAQVDVKTMPTVTVEAAGGDKIFAFESIVEEALSNSNLVAGINTLNGTPVGAGKVVLITAAAIVYVGTVPTRIRINASGLAVTLCLLDQPSPASGQYYPLHCAVYLQAGDYMQGEVKGATAGDDLYFRYAGVQMDAP